MSRFAVWHKNSELFLNLKHNSDSVCVCVCVCVSSLLPNMLRLCQCSMVEPLLATPKLNFHKGGAIRHMESYILSGCPMDYRTLYLT